MFAPDDFVGIAEALRAGSADKPTERRFRTSISRAYYAVFLSLRQHIRVARSDSSYDVEHHKLARFLADHPNQKVGHFGNEFRNLFNRRTDSDYRLHVSVTESWESLAVLSAKDLIKRAGGIVKLVPPSSFPMRVL